MQKGENFKLEKFPKITNIQINQRQLKLVFGPSLSGYAAVNHKILNRVLVLKNLILC